MKFGVIEIGIGLLVIYALSKKTSAAMSAAAVLAQQQAQVNSLGYVPNSSIGATNGNSYFYETTA